MIVQNRLTPLAAADAGRALFAAYAQLTGAQPTDSVGALLLSQSALETGNWQKIHNFNFGNLKARTDYPQIVQFRCSEVIDGVERFFDPPDPQCNFRAYASATEGAVDYLKVLHGQPHWWRGLQSGDPSVFVDALATPPKYFTADPERYKRTLVALYQQFRPLAAAVLRARLSPAPAAPVSPSLPPSSPLASSSAPSVPQNAPAEPATAPGALSATTAISAQPVPESPVPGSPAASGRAPTPRSEVPVPVAPKHGAAEVMADAAKAIAVVADAAEAIVVAGGLNGGGSTLPTSTPASRAAAIVRLLRWLAQLLAWLFGGFRSSGTKPGSKVP
ncbi:MAG TPA: hypothetical protein VG937_00105 [Polyangiaceae bacterium]|nr:hypothetical protein [Polyangiaceae bacterium]